ncbi:MAG: PLP-dependent aminotransferase family protein [Clostridiales Family XIII bacterium]|jgi:2-aminoadipate transaminase|nr:PLP-dependent aminotransferase family protein [Clostridiales Family XIII bacterium]
MYEFSDRVNNIKPSAIREMFKLMGDPEIIAFSGGNPAKESFEYDTIREITTDLLAGEPSNLLQYGITEGYDPLREAYIKHILEPKGLSAGLENILITTGGSQGLFISISAFLNEGDTVLIEAPTFLGTLMVFDYLNVNCVSVAMDENGIVLEDLEAKIKEHNPKMLYTIPTFQNPTGYTLSLDRRKRVAELADEHGFIVLEDDPYCDLRYKGEALPPIKTFDKSGKVVMLNSMSKIIAPGIRVGVVVAEPEIISKVTVAKQAIDTHTATLTQAICAEYLGRGLLPGHLERTTPMYRERLDTMLDGFKHFPSEVKFSKPEGGLFVWVTLPGEQDVDDIAKKAIAEKVAFVPGAPFFNDKSLAGSTLRLNFSASTPDRIAIGMERLGKVITDNLK